MRVTVNIPDPIGAEAENAARQQKVSVSALYAQAVELYLRARRREQAVARINTLLGRSQVAPDAASELERERTASERPLA